MRCHKLFFIAALLFSFPAFAQVRLPRLIRDSMVLQRETKIRVWGWASPGEKVKIKFNRKDYKTTTGADGKWMLYLSPMKAGGPYEMNIDASNHITLKDILIGDVWICSGQSNMVHQMILHRERYEDEIKNANYPAIRHFWISTMTDLNRPHDDLPSGYWKSANPEDVLQFSAVAYFFAKDIYEKYHVPIGLINASVGGTPVEAWTSEEGLKEFPSVYSTITRNKDTAYINTTTRNAAAVFAKRSPIKDMGLESSVKWFDNSYIPKGWHAINVPGYWEDQGLRNFDGIVWYRKEIDVPADMTGVPAVIHLGRIVDADMLYVNGKNVASTSYQYPQRRYAVPAGVLKAGKNIFVVRVTNNFGKGGFVPDKPYDITAGGKKIDLKGEWQYKVGYIQTPQPDAVSISAQNQPTALYNAMIAPLINYTIKGFLWYQGEANSGRATEYESLFPALINDWRKKWALGDLPFLYVQLPNYMEVNYTPAESQWASLRNAQLKTLSVPNTGMAVAIDLGEWNDIHPDRKKDVGDRLALLAEKMVYGDKSVVASGPMFQNIKADGSKLVIEFSNAGSGLVSNDGEDLKWFAIAGADQKYVWAHARIEGYRVVVWNENISNPVYVRYAWADNPVDVNFYNREGLPAAPFAANILQSDLNTTSNGPWNHKGSAVVLTYDDALNVHIDNAKPLLDSLGLKATFYVSGYSGVLHKRMEEWKKMAANGHELGNHTLFHPCSGSLPGRSFVTPENDLDKYTVSKMVNEIRLTNALLQAMDGKSERTFAYPCGDTKIGGVSYIDEVKKEFTGARGVQFALQDAPQVDLFDIKCFGVNGQSGDELVSLVKQAMEQHKLLVFLFHGVGGEHGLNVSLEAHRQLLQYLKSHENEIWITPMTTVASYIRQQTQQKN